MVNSTFFSRSGVVEIDQALESGEPGSCKERGLLNGVFTGLLVFFQLYKLMFVFTAIAGFGIVHAAITASLAFVVP